ncbi:hypothetical protein QJS04_geneDACA003163 [Acorus gramineus]|uniref:Uncharacterized protein n=1 Tax=Acorus gramineus TaxID=55184 RepID=A0AAV9BT58_ACOGR|nr:hypothetical protein QJS04_geneDACA003163 [Acorus gramineus]
MAPPSIARSSLEEMLDTIKRRDELPKDVPPALPTRPTSRSRRPSSRRSLPVSVKILFQKLRVWCWPQNIQWELGRVQSITGENVQIILSDGTVVRVPTENILPANPDILEGVDDLIQLSYLNEPSVLHNLNNRFSHDMIYTKAGPVLVAINPFKKVSLYGNDRVSAYRQKLTDKPHVYAISDTAFNQMMRAILTHGLLHSGESGAGKTETAKIAMQYLAALGGGSGIENEVLKTSSILESFGNAKTLRNDNSSRFGKLIEIRFATSGKICGARIQTFSFEQSRVVQRAKGERSYHIFYQLCAGAPPRLKEHLNLKSAREYDYLNQSDCLTIDDVDDARRFKMLMEALDVVQIRKEDQRSAFAMLAAVLWLGNISFSVIDNENHVETVEDEGVTTAARLMGCGVRDLMLSLSTRKIQVGNDNIVQKLTLSKAIDARDALAKSIYASLFDWLVEQINNSLEAGKENTGRSISILDIYGFESFHKNGFEQFCINYANERLQQHFNRHLFKLEQEDYTQDGIDWTRVEFEDNQECLNLFEKKPLGLLSLLDEESNFPKATDLTFATKLKQHLNSNYYFKGERGGAFKVCHYAGEVLYDTSGFLEKNRDPLHIDFMNLLSSCRCELPQLFGRNMLNESKKLLSPLRRLHATDSQKQSVGAKFKVQLFKLMQRLENTSPHFIRCIKPNTKQLPGIYDKDLVLQQLRCCGVLEVVRIARSGYPTRMTHQQFAKRYGFLLLEDVESHDPLSISVAVLQHYNVLPDMYQVGYTKLFFRTGQIGALDDARNQTLQGILAIQKGFRGQSARRAFKELKKASMILQSYVRGEKARKEFEYALNSRRAAIVIQKHVKQHIAKRAYNDQKIAVIHIQSVIRGWLARKHLSFLQNVEVLKLKLKDPDGEDDYDDFKDFEQERAHQSALEELERRVFKAETALKQKEEENAILKLQLQQYDVKWLDYEAKMTSMEEMWQQQMTSLQMSLAAARKSLAADDTMSQPGRFDASPSPLYYESDDGVSLESRTPESVPVRSRTSDPGTDVGQHAVNRLIRDFEQRTHVFDYDARSVIEGKSGQSSSNMNPKQELRKLKKRFIAWKKEFKVRLHETKATFQKRGNSEVERTWKNWWGKRTTRDS